MPHYCLQNFSYSPPCQLHTHRFNCLRLLRLMEYDISHIYCEGNEVADTLFNDGSDFHIPTWWDSPPHSILFSFRFLG